MPSYGSCCVSPGEEKGVGASLLVNAAALPRPAGAHPVARRPGRKGPNSQAFKAGATANTLLLPAQPATRSERPFPHPPASAAGRARGAVGGGASLERSPTRLTCDLLEPRRSAPRAAQHRRGVHQQATADGSPRPPPPRCRKRLASATDTRRFRKSRRQRPTLPGRPRPSTIGAEGLNCWVRDGTRCFPLAKAAGNQGSG